MSGFNSQPKADFAMEGKGFTSDLGVDYRLQPTVLVGVAVAYSQSDVDYMTADVTRGDIDITLMSVLPYAHRSPRPGSGVWGLVGAGWGDLAPRDEAGKMKTDLEMRPGAVRARQEVEVAVDQSGLEGGCVADGVGDGGRRPVAADGGRRARGAADGGRAHYVGAIGRFTLDTGVRGRRPVGRGQGGREKNFSPLRSPLQPCGL